MKKILVSASIFLGIMISFTIAYHLLNLYHGSRLQKVGIIIILVPICSAICYFWGLPKFISQPKKWLLAAVMLAIFFLLINHYQPVEPPRNSLLWTSLSIFITLADIIVLATMIWWGLLSIKDNKQIMLVLMMGILLFLFFYRWIPVAQTYYNEQNLSDVPPNVDFQSYYIAGKNFLAGFNSYMSEVSGFSSWLIYLYPPSILPFLGMLSKLDYDIARQVWLIIYLTFFAAACISVILLEKKEQRIRLGLLLLIIIFISHACLFLIRQGQIDLLVISLIMISYCCYKKEHKFISAVILAIATWIKINPVLFLITLGLFYRDIKYFVYVAICGLGIGLVSLIWVPWELQTYYFLHVLPEVTSGSTWYKNQSIIRFVGEMKFWPQAISVCGFGLLALITRYINKREITGINQMTQRSDFVFALNAAFILLFSGISWHMSFVWLIIISAIVYQYVIQSGKPFWVVCFGMAIMLTQAKIETTPFFDTLNTTGAVLLILCIIGFIYQETRSHQHVQTTT